MTTLRTAAQQALEALEMSRRFVYADNRPQCDEAIDALRAALAQQEETVPHPGVWMHPWPPVRAQQAEPTVKECLQVESVATTQQRVDDTSPSDYRRGYWDGFEMGKREGRLAAEDAAKQAAPKGGGNPPPPWRCPQCGGPADNGHDRELPPNPYWCTRCVANARDDWK